MSVPVRDVCLEEGSILSLIRDYFELAGHAECLLAVEHCCNGTNSQPHLLPLELAALREVVLGGKWDQVMQYLDRFTDTEDKEGLKRCRYLAHKQKYLEILHHVESDIQARLRLGFGYCSNGELLSSSEAEKVRQVMELQLTTLEPFCPSLEDFRSLKTLLSMPSISSSKDFSMWQVHSGRLDTLHQIREWVSKSLYLNVKTSSSQEAKKHADGGVGSSCTLLRLLAKGLLYEQCERLCRARYGEADTDAEKISCILDLRGWLQQQPDSSFQLLPSKLSLVVSPWTRPSQSGLEASLSVDIGALNRESKISLANQATGVAAKSASTFLPMHDVVPPQVPNDVQGDEMMDLEARGNTQQEQTGSLAAHEDAPTSEEGLTLVKEPSATQKVLEETQKVLEVQQSKVFMVPSVPDPPMPANPPVPADPSVPVISNPPMAVISKPVISDSPMPAAISVTSAPPIPAATSAVSAPIPVVTSNLKPSQSNILPSNSSESKPSERSLPSPNEVDGPRIDHEAVSKEDGVAAFLPSTTPLRKTGRDSSTPKNVKASRASLKTSPPSSPIATRPLARISPRAKVPAHVAHSSPHVDMGGEQGTRRYKESQKSPTVSFLSAMTDSQAVRSVAFSASGNIVALGANSGTLRVSNTTSLLDNKISEELELVYQKPHHHRGSIYCLAWYGDTLLASGSNDKNISLLTCSTSRFKAQKALPPHSGTIRDVLFTSDGLLVYGGGISPEIQVTDIQTYQSVVSLSGHTDQVLALGILPGGLLASGGQDNTVLLWDMRSRLPVSTLSLDLAIASLASSGDHLVTSHLDGSCAVYNLNTFKCLSTYTAHSKECRSVRYRPVTGHGQRKSWVLSGSYDKTVCLTDTESLQWTKLCQHKDKVIQCRWHPAGNIFATTGADKRACFWSIAMN